jgi:hypothetical protein
MRVLCDDLNFREYMKARKQYLENRPKKTTKFDTYLKDLEMKMIKGYKNPKKKKKNQKVFDVFESSSSEHMDDPPTMIVRDKNELKTAVTLRKKVAGSNTKTKKLKKTEKKSDTMSIRQMEKCQSSVLNLQIAKAKLARKTPISRRSKLDLIQSGFSPNTKSQNEEMSLKKESGIVSRFTKRQSSVESIGRPLSKSGSDASGTKDGNVTKIEVSLLNIKVNFLIL